MIRFDLQPVFNLHDRHPGRTLQQFDHDPFVVWVEMLNENEGHAACLLHIGEELIQRFQPPGERRYR